MFRAFLESPAPVQSFTCDEHIYLLSENHIQVFDPVTRQKMATCRLFKKDGLARTLSADASYLYCSDFTDLYILAKESLEVLACLRLGTDLSSDICAKALPGEQRMYVAIRNGSVVCIEKETWQVRTFPVSASSIWAMARSGGKLYAGNVEGDLLVLHPDTLQVERRIPAHRQNLKSLCIQADWLATAAQDKALALWDLNTLEPMRVKKNAHRKAFSIAGFWGGYLLTVSYPCGEIKVWDAVTLRQTAVLPITACLSGETHLDGARLYLSSRAILGLDALDLDQALPSAS